MGAHNSENIEIRNPYRMLTYALRTFDVTAFESVDIEEYGGLEQVLAELLLTGVNLQRKRGLEHGYRDTRENLQFVRGKLEVAGTVVNRARGSLLVDCTFDEYTVDTFLNRVLKLAMLRILSLTSVSQDQKARVRALMPHFDQVSDLPASAIRWSDARFDRNNATYRLLLNVAYLLVNDLGITSRASSHVTPGIVVKDRPLLFQYFVLNYFRQHFPQINVYSERRLKGGLESHSGQIPILKPDITLEADDVCVILDTKFYGRILETGRFDGKKRLRSGHRNQILTYASHAQAGTSKTVKGLLLYAQTPNETHEETNFAWRELGIDFASRTVDLGMPFEDVARSLDRLVTGFFPSVTRVPY